MARTTSTPEASARPKRTPLSVRNRLNVKNKEDGYVYRIVNDVDDHVPTLTERGYELCDMASIGAVGDKRVDNTTSIGSVAHFSVGQGMKAVVMRIKKEWYEEDQATKQQQVDEIEATMKQEARNAGDYIPKFT
jgi:hypothetical protein